MSQDKNKLSQKYNDQNRGSKSDYDHYFATMDVTMKQKLAFIGAHFLLKPGAVIADMGCGSGLGSYQLALLNPHIQVVGIDINPESVRMAREKYQLPNLRFEVGDVENPDPALGPFDGVLDSSVLHHVSSFNNYDSARVVNAVKNQMACMNVSGQMVIRDFVAWPDDEYYLLDLSAEGKDDTILGMSDADLLVRFSQTAKPLTPEKGKGFFLEELECPGSPEKRRFRLAAKWVGEFLLRKDYRENWDVELLEDYGFWTKKDYERELTALGGRVVYTAPFWNSWIIENRFRGKVQIYTEDGTPIDFPPTNFVAVVEKVAPGDSLSIGENAISQNPPSYLVRQKYENQTTGRVHDLVGRPGEVADYLPYKIGTDGKLHIYAKHGYPRPLVNTIPRGTPSLDQKSWSGHMIELISVASDGQEDKKRQALAARLGLGAEHLGQETEAARYYPSPGLCDEFVQSVFVEVNGTDDFYSADIDPAVSGFSTSGTTRTYRAQDVLRAAQVGILSEARLELNTYLLMQKMGETPDVWIGSEKIAGTPAKYNFSATTLEALSGTEKVQAFTPTEKPSTYLRHIRSTFNDVSDTKENARQEYEFVIPAKPGMGTNVVSALPLAQGLDGEWYVGLERRDLPAPQLKEGNSRLTVTPAYRLPNSVETLENTADFVTEKFGVTRDKVRQLGEGYFSSIGVMPERVFPYIVHVDPAQLKEPLHFVPLRDLFAKPELLRDAHLVIAAMRGIHSMGLWAEYAPKPEILQETAPGAPKNQKL